MEIELLIFFFFFGGNFRLTDGYTCHFEYLTVDLMVYMTINSRLMVCVRVCVFFWTNLMTSTLDLETLFLEVLKTS